MNSEKSQGTTAALDTADMGKVLVDITLTNIIDEADRIRGRLTSGEVRQATLRALVDTGATMLVIPESTVRTLGLSEVRKVKTKMADGRVIQRVIYGPVKLKVLEREVNVDAISAPDSVPALLGQIPLEGLDYHIDPKGQRLIPNPESPDMALMDLF